MLEGVRDELAEFDVTEAEFDATLDEGQPVEVVGPPDPFSPVDGDVAPAGHRGSS